MGQLLVFVICCSALAVSHADQDGVYKSLHSFQDKPKLGRIDTLKDNYVKQLFLQLLGRKSQRLSLRVERSNNGGLNRLENSQFPTGGFGPGETLLLHRELQQRLGWGSEDKSNQQFGPPPPPNQQFGFPPNQPQPSPQYGFPPNQPQPSPQYGFPPNQPQPSQSYKEPNEPSQSYGVLPPPQNPQFGFPPNQPQPSQSYKEPNEPSQSYGVPPPPPNPQFGFPPNQPQPSQSYKEPNEPSQSYGVPPPSQSYDIQQMPAPPNNNIRVNQGTFGGHIENFKLSDAIRTNGVNNHAPTPQSQYGLPDTSSFNNEIENRDTPKIFKHVYIHSPKKEDYVPEKPRIIRPNKKPDTHYQVIFVKAPSPPQQPPTEIELPSPPERKTLVYVLVKKPEKPAEIKFRAPPTTPPPKPEVYFIRYKGKNGGKNGASEPQDDIQSFRNGATDNGYDSIDNGGYSSSYNSQPEIISTKSVDGPIASIANNLIRESVDYPNTEYRAPPNMLSPNQEPMSIAVYDRIRNGVMPSSSSAGRRGTLDTASSNISPQFLVRRHQGSHYTAPGSKPFLKSSGKMVHGQYVGMTSDVSNSQYYSVNRQSNDNHEY